MKKITFLVSLILLLLFSGLTSCRQAIQPNDYLVMFNDTLTDGYGYKNANGDIVIATGKYDMCFTDTFKTYAIVVKLDSLFWVAIDRQEKVLYEIYLFDNGPDYVSDGLFRITENNKIGYADSFTGNVIIKPQFDCALPLENGVAQVSTECKTESDGEHSAWVSNNWFYIDKTGRKVGKPKTAKE